MSTPARFYTFGDRQYRREKMAKAYLAGATSRQVADAFGLSDSYVREVMRASGIARPVGRPRGIAA